MRIDRYTKTILTIIALLLAVVSLRPLFQPQTAIAESFSYAYLVPQAGSADTQGGKHFIDLRNGKLWMCNFKECKVDGTYPFEKTH